MNRRGRVNGSRRVALAFVSFCIAICPILPAAAATTTTQFPYYQPHHCDNAYSIQQEIKLGKKAQKQVYKKMKVLPDSSPITQYVQEVGERLVAEAPGYHWPYSFHVVVSKNINAFALPGGAVFVNTALIAAARNESELAGVMAHEIGHVVQRAATCNITKRSKRGIWWGLAGILSNIFIPGVGGTIAQRGIGFAQNLRYLQMSRTDEEQADKLGVEILNRAGYNPRGMVAMFRILERKAGSGGVQFLSDHPNPGNRIEYLKKEIAALPAQPGSTVNTPQYERIHRLVEEKYPPE